MSIKINVDEIINIAREKYLIILKKEELENIKTLIEEEKYPNNKITDSLYEIFLIWVEFVFNCIEKHEEDSKLSDSEFFVKYCIDPFKTFSFSFEDILYPHYVKNHRFSTLAIDSLYYLKKYYESNEMDDDFKSLVSDASSFVGIFQETIMGSVFFVARDYVKEYLI